MSLNFDFFLDVLLCALFSYVVITVIELFCLIDLMEALI